MFQRKYFILVGTAGACCVCRILTKGQSSKTIPGRSFTPVQIINRLSKSNVPFTFGFGALLLFGATGYGRPVGQSSQVCVCPHALNGTREAKHLDGMDNLSTFIHSLIF